MATAAFIPRLNSGFWPTSWKFDDTCGAAGIPDVNDPDFQTKVVMWSYPIIRNGLIYVIGVRNGLFILRYTGTRADEVGGIQFLEGNSNLGDAVALDEQ